MELRLNTISAVYSTSPRVQSKRVRDNDAIMGFHSGEKIGRNDPCPCGSGRKFKRCCLTTESAPESEDTPWRRQREASDRLAGEMLKFVRRRFEDAVFAAWMDFNQNPFPEPLDKLESEGQIFFPYFLFDWDPDAPPPHRGTRPRAGVVARAFMEEKAKRLSDLELLILEQSIIQPLSFYEVIDCNPGHGMVLRDVLIGREAMVEEHSGSQFAQVGDIIYAQLCRLPDVTTLARMAPVPLAPRNKAEVVELRAVLRRKIAKQNRELAEQDLIRYREQIRAVYLQIRDSRNRPPKLVNTDGDPLVFHTLTYQVGSAQVAFDALAPLAWSSSREELLEDAEVDEDGVLLGVSFDWSKKGNAMHANWDNTIMGHISISGRSMVVEVNSAQRAKEIRKEIEKRLGMLAVLTDTSSKRPEQMIEESKRKKSTEAESLDSEAIEPEIDPEVLREWHDMMQEEVNAWVHSKIPLLGGRTPMEAVADPDGKEIVESLLLEWERRNETATGKGAFCADLNAVRRALNLEVAHRAENGAGLGV